MLVSCKTYRIVMLSMFQLSSGEGGTFIQVNQGGGHKFCSQKKREGSTSPIIQTQYNAECIKVMRKLNKKWWGAVPCEDGC